MTEYHQFMKHFSILIDRSFVKFVLLRRRHLFPFFHKIFITFTAGHSVLCDHSKKKVTTCSIPLICSFAKAQLSDPRTNMSVDLQSFKWGSLVLTNCNLFVHNKSLEQPFPNFFFHLRAPWQPTSIKCTLHTKVSHLKTLNMFYLVIYWTQKVHNDFIFLCSIALPPVGHSSNHQYHCVQLTRQSSCVSNFYRNFKFFIWLSLLLSKCL